MSINTEFKTINGLSTRGTKLAFNYNVDTPKLQFSIPVLTEILSGSETIQSTTVSSEVINLATTEMLADVLYFDYDDLSYIEDVITDNTEEEETVTIE